MPNVIKEKANLKHQLSLPLAAALLGVACSQPPAAPGISSPARYEASSTGASVSAEDGTDLKIYRLDSAGNRVAPPAPDARSRGFVPGGFDPKERGKRVPRRQMVDNNAPTPGEAQWGTKFPYLSGIGDTGVYAGNQVISDLAMPPTNNNSGNGGVWLYAPTLYGANDCNLEIVTAYHRLSNSDTDGGVTGNASVLPAGSTERFIGLYDHTNGVKRFVYTIPMSTSWFQSAYLADFYSAYTGAYQGKLYFAKIERRSGVWRAYLYDYVQGAWTGMNNGYSASGAGAPQSFGWNQFETYYFQFASPNCPQMPTINGTRAMQQTSSGWTAATGALNNMGTQLQCNSTWNAAGNHVFTHNYDDWLVKTQ